MDKLFSKIENAGFILPDELKSEISDYFNRIDNNDVKERMKDAIIVILKKYKGIEGEQLRNTCLCAIFKQIGLDVMHSRAKKCSKKFCNYVIELYVGKGFRNFDIKDRKVFYRVDGINDDILDGMKLFYLGAYYDGDAFCNIVSIGGMDILQQRLDQFATIYPDADRSRLVEYILYYTRTRTYLRLDDDAMVDLISKMARYGIDFFAYTDKLHDCGEVTSLIDLEMYVNNLVLLTSMGYPVDKLFTGYIPSNNDVKLIIKAIKLNIMVEIDIFVDIPEKVLEFLSWEVNKLPIGVYFKQDYKKIGQLRVIRLLLLNNLDPGKFSINPSMSSDEMLEVINEKLCLYSPNLTLMTM